MDLFTKTTLSGINSYEVYSFQHYYLSACTQLIRFLMTTIFCLRSQYLSRLLIVNGSIVPFHCLMIDKLEFFADKTHMMQ